MRSTLRRPDPSRRSARIGPSGGVVVVIGSCGGVGASTLAALLAVRGRSPTTLVDLAPASGGLDVTLGIEATPGPRWPALIGAPPADLALPSWRGVRVLSADRTGVGPDPGTLAGVWETLLASGDRLVVDLPPAAVPAAGPVLTAADAVVLVVGQDVRGVAGGIAVRPLLGAAPVPLILRERRRARVAPAEVAAMLDGPVVARLPHDRALADGVDAGVGPRCAVRSRLGRALTALTREVPG